MPAFRSVVFFSNRKRAQMENVAFVSLAKRAFAHPCREGFKVSESVNDKQQRFWLCTFLQTTIATATGTSPPACFSHVQLPCNFLTPSLVTCLLFVFFRPCGLGLLRTRFLFCGRFFFSRIWHKSAFSSCLLAYECASKSHITRWHAARQPRNAKRGNAETAGKQGESRRWRRPSMYQGVRPHEADTRQRGP